MNSPDYETLYHEHLFAITHELRSPLAILDSNTLNQLQLLRILYEKTKDDPEAVDAIKKLKDTIRIIDEQVYTMESFITNIAEHGNYNKSDSATELVYMKGYLDNIIKLIPSFSRKMSVFGDDGIFYDADGWDWENVHIAVVPSDLNRIVMNIIINAADAVSSCWKSKNIYSSYSPSLRIRCIKANSVDKRIRLHENVYGPAGAQNLNNSVYLVIEDNGPGIEKKYLNHIFRNGFSTKENTGENYGYGLYICNQLAKKNGISIFVDTKVGEWTRFFLGFPQYFLSPKQELDNGTKVNTKDLRCSSKACLNNFSKECIELRNCYSCKNYEDKILEADSLSDEDSTIKIFKSKRKK